MSIEMSVLGFSLGKLQSDISELSTGAMAKATVIMNHVRGIENISRQATTITTLSHKV